VEWALEETPAATLTVGPEGYQCVLTRVTLRQDDLGQLQCLENRSDGGTPELLDGEVPFGRRFGGGQDFAPGVERREWGLSDGPELSERVMDQSDG